MRGACRRRRCRGGPSPPEGPRQAIKAELASSMCSRHRSSKIAVSTSSSARPESRDTTSALPRRPGSVRVSDDSGGAVHGGLPGPANRGRDRIQGQDDHRDASRRLPSVPMGLDVALGRQYRPSLDRAVTTTTPMMCLSSSSRASRLADVTDVALGRRPDVAGTGPPRLAPETSRQLLRGQAPPASPIATEVPVAVNGRCDEAVARSSQLAGRVLYGKGGPVRLEGAKVVVPDLGPLDLGGFNCWGSTTSSTPAAPSRLLS